MGETLRQLSGLMAVFGLLGFCVWKLGNRRGAFSLARFTRGSRGSPKVVQKVERLVLTPQHTLHVLSLRGQEIMVVTHCHGCTLLTPEKEIGRGVGA